MVYGPKEANLTIKGLFFWSKIRKITSIFWVVYKAIKLSIIIIIYLFVGQYTNYENIAQPSIVHRALFKASNHNPFHLCPLNISHSDAGLIGFYLVAEGEKVGFFNLNDKYFSRSFLISKRLLKVFVNLETAQLIRNCSKFVFK